MSTDVEHCALPAAMNHEKVVTGKPVGPAQARSPDSPASPASSPGRIRRYAGRCVRTMMAQARLGLGALGALALLACGAPPACGQMAGGNSAAPPVAATFSYSGELVQHAAGGARRGATFAGMAGVQVTFLLGRLVGWHG